MKKQLVLLNEFSRVRTQLANERTLLSYLSASFAVVTGALILPKIYSGRFIAVASVSLTIAGIFLAVTGSILFVRRHKKISLLKEKQKLSS